MRSTTTLGSDELASLDNLGKGVRLARLRRRLTQAELAERMGVARTSVVALESGSPGLAVGILLKALTVLGYTDKLGALLAVDPIGDDMDLADRRRAGRRRDVADF